MSRPEWTDRRIMVYGMLVYTAIFTAFAAVYKPMAASNSLIGSAVEYLIGGSVFVVTGYTAGRIAQRHKALRDETNKKGGK